MGRDAIKDIMSEEKTNEKTVNGKIVDFDKLTEPLNADEIEFRILSINKGGYATILAYKDARVDIRRLNKCVGFLNWKRKHTRDNKNCVVSIYDSEKNEWVSKEDTGTESYTDKEKGLASDSFKRSCFNWGIGLELYDYPVISVPLKKSESGDRSGEWFIDTNDKNKPKQGWGLNLRSWKWLSYFENKTLVYLQAIDESGSTRFIYGIKPESIKKEEEKQSKFGERISIINSHVNKDIKHSLKEAGYNTPTKADKYCLHLDYDLAKIRLKLGIILNEQA